VKRAFKIPLAGVSFILFLITLLLYLYFFTTVPEQRVNDWLGYYLKDKIGYTLTVDKINRDIWRRVRLDGIKILYESDDKQSVVQVGDIGCLEAEYSLKNIIFQDLSFKEIKVVDFNMSILPEVKPEKLYSSEQKKSPDKKTTVPEINVERFNLENIKLVTLFKQEIVTINIPKVFGSFLSDGDIISLSLDSLSVDCPEKNFEVNSCRGNFSLIKDDLMIEFLALKTGRSDITVSGKIDNLNNPDFNLTYDFSPLDLWDIKTISGVNLNGNFQAHGNINGRIKDFSGEISGDGILFDRNIDGFKTNFSFTSNILHLDSFDGSIFRSPTKGSGFVNFGTKPESFGFKGSMIDFNLENLGVDIYSGFTGKIDIKGEGFAEHSFHMNIEMELSKADIDMYHFHQAKGEIDFDLSYLIFQPGFKANYKNTWTTFDGILEYSGLIDLSGSVEFNDLTDFTNQFFIADLDGVGKSSFSVTGPTKDFTINGSFDSDSCRFYGLVMDTLSFEVDLKSFISHRVGTVQGSWKGGDIYSIPVDSGFFSVLVSGEKIFLDKVFWENENNEMLFTGSYDNGNIPPTLVIDTLNIRLWNDTVFCIDPLIIDVFEKEVEFEDFKLYSRESMLEMTGTVTYEGEMNLDLSGSNLEIKPIFNYFISDRTISGILSGSMKVTGDFDLPEFSTDFSIIDLAINDVNLGKFDVEAGYDKSKLMLNSANLQSEQALYSLSGSFPLNLSFTTDEERLPDESISARFTASGNSIVLVPVFVPSVENLDGDFNVDIAFSGTYRNPLANGNFAIINGTLKALELMNPATGITLNGHMENDIIYIDNLAGLIKSADNRKNKKFKKATYGIDYSAEDPGVLSGSGTIKLLGLGLFDYNLNLSGADCEFYTDAYDIQGLADIYLSITGSSPPLVSGWVQLTKFEMKEPFATFSTGMTEGSEVLEDSTVWDMKLEVAATNNLWIKNSEADMELKGDVLISREKGIYNTLGQLDVIRGNFFLWNLKFAVDKGEMVFNNISDIDPEINFDVRTRIRGSSETGSTQEYSNFNLRISGTLTKPEIKTAEGSEYSDEDMLTILLSNTVEDMLSILDSNTGTGSDKSSSMADNLIKNTSGYLLQLYNPFEEYGVIDEFDINPYDKEGIRKTTEISVAKYISPKLFLRYSQRLSQEAGQTFGIEYFFNDKISFEGKQGTKNEGVSLDLKFRYEF